MPLLVDEIVDPVGNAYSGMPTQRLYVIDRQGKCVAYKSGRGPFGFKSGEMEQGKLVMAPAGAAARSPTTERKNWNEPMQPPNPEK